MSSSVKKSEWRSCVSALLILTVIGLTFGFLYAMEYFVYPAQTACNEVESMKNSMQCFLKLSNELTNLYQSREHDQRILSSANETQIICRPWQQYFNCTSSVAENCGKTYDAGVDYKYVLNELSHCNFTKTIFESIS